MTKDIIYCESCNRNIITNGVYHKYIKDNGHVSKCNVCEWKEKHKDIIDSITDYTAEELDRFIIFFIYKESIYLNDIADILNKSIDQMIELFKILKIANRKCLIKTTCDYCGKEFEMKITPYCISKNHYCSRDCYWNDKPNTVGHGEENICYNRVTVNCDNCGKTINIIPSRLNKQNSYGENHNFCSRECYSEFRSKYYIGEKTYNFERVLSPETINKMRIATASRQKDSCNVNTSIQLAINSILDEMNIIYTREYLLGYYSIDNYLNESNLAIEVMGDYWHSNPMIYNAINRKINNTQYRDIIIDKRKNTYVRKYAGISILYLWESDIRHNIKLCKELINHYIKNKGIIENYNSFNWMIENNNIVLCQNIIQSYLESDISCAQNILKVAS